VILGIGSQKGTRVGCDGDDAGNVLSGIDFPEKDGAYRRENGLPLGKPWPWWEAEIPPWTAAAHRCAVALRKVYVIYRRTEKEMPANPIEIHESKLEGVEYYVPDEPYCASTRMSMAT
jgi:hypothetical protein